MTFKEIRDGLVAMNQHKQELKRKVKEDTKLTSDHIKSMERLRLQSTDRVARTELKEDQTKRDLQQLHSMIKRGDEVEKKRMERVKSKEAVLKTLVSKDSAAALEELMKDSKCYLKSRISTVMVDVVKGVSTRSNRTIKSKNRSQRANSQSNRSSNVPRPSNPDNLEEAEMVDDVDERYD